MRELEFNVLTWLGPADSASVEDATVASLAILVGSDQIPLTEVDDTIARTVRPHINVSAYALARWLLVNWWRLRWEPSSKYPRRDWSQAHSLASIGGGYAWPPLQLSSDGQFLQLQIKAEAQADVSAVRYLRDLTVDVPAADFETAVEAFLDLVQGRLAGLSRKADELLELRAELCDERAKPHLAELCRLQALAGIDPGSAPPEWLDGAKTLVGIAGPVSGDELMAAVPNLKGGLGAAADVVGAMRISPTTVKFETVPSTTRAFRPGQLPWEKGAALATEMRHRLGVTSGPLTNAVLEQSLDVKLPLPSLASAGPVVSLQGGFRSGSQDGRTAVVVRRAGVRQRFDLARIIGCAMLLGPDEHVLPVCDTGTALQKFQRSFAQELLCPWTELDAFTDDNGTDEDGVELAAKHFEVSQQVINTTLVNKRKVSRDRLPAA